MGSNRPMRNTNPGRSHHRTNQKFDIKADVLVSLALIASIITGEHFAAGEVAFIMQIGALLEELTVSKARAGIKKLIHLTPQTARLLTQSGAEQIIPAKQVKQGDTLRVLPGETIPVDGIIQSGQTSVNQAVMTGESLPIDKSAGDEVCSGTVNQFGTFEMKATKVGEDSSIQRMIRLVQSADADKAKIVGMADKWATWIVVIALIAAALNNRYIGYIALADTLRKESAAIIKELTKIGVTPILLTGDNENAAKAIASEIGIETVYANCLPENKRNIIKQYQNEKNAVCMIGDGINDAPALKTANVGIAMGGIGSDIAVDAADIALVNDEIKELPHLIALSKRMMTTIKYNLTFSMGLNFLAIILAITGILNPIVGALVHNCGSVLVIINSAFLLKWNDNTIH